MIKNFADGGAAINVIAKELNAKIEVICLGVVFNPVSNSDAVEVVSCTCPYKK